MWTSDRNKPIPWPVARVSLFGRAEVEQVLWRAVRLACPRFGGFSTWH
jgi:hypothetical protein